MVKVSTIFEELWVSKAKYPTLKNKEYHFYPENMICLHKFSIQMRYLYLLVMLEEFILLKICEIHYEGDIMFKLVTWKFITIFGFVVFFFFWITITFEREFLARFYILNTKNSNRKGNSRIFTFWNWFLLLHSNIVNNE